jgi:hypothetical protein
MVGTGVTIFFQGHDHLFARQEKDGVTYQTLPEPADATGTYYNREAYHSGDLFPNPGRARVSVSPEKVRVEYVRLAPPGTSSAARSDEACVFSYEIPAAKGQLLPGPQPPDPNGAN